MHFLYWYFLSHSYAIAATKRLTKTGGLTQLNVFPSILEEATTTEA